MNAAYDRLTRAVLRLLRVPPEPHAPHGDPASLRVFRAGPNHLRLKIAGWGVGQAAAFAGICFWLWIFVDLELATDDYKYRRAAAAAQPKPVPAPPPAVATPVAPAAPAAATATAPEKPAKAEKSSRPARNRRSGYAGWKQNMAVALAQMPDWAFPLLWALKLAGLAAYLVQLPLTYIIARLDYDLRWYLVTDRSLRIRHGLWKVYESTMSFANVQQVVVTQGPLQRLLKLADVRVTSAGGGGGGHDPQGKSADEAMHTGLFHNVTNAADIRDLIQERLRRFRESGLGDPDEASQRQAPPPAPAATAPAADGEMLAAARELAAEARALREALR